MHLFQFYIRPERIQTTHISITGEEFSHCCRVLRKRIGDMVNVIDGIGNHYEARIQSIERDQAVAEIVRKYSEPEIRPAISLGFGLVKHKALDMIIPQISSMGVRTLFPLHTRHSVKQGFQKSRFLKKAIEAVKQSGSAFLPDIEEETTLSEWFKRNAGAGLKIIAEPDHAVPLWTVIREKPEISSVAAMIGPEGGFDEEEVENARAQGYQVVSLGDRRLRAELAATVLVANILVLTNAKET